MPRSYQFSISVFDSVWRVSPFTALFTALLEIGSSSLLITLATTLPKILSSRTDKLQSSDLVFSLFLAISVLAVRFATHFCYMKLSASLRNWFLDRSLDPLKRKFRDFSEANMLLTLNTVLDDLSQTLPRLSLAAPTAVISLLLFLIAAFDEISGFSIELWQFLLILLPILITLLARNTVKNLSRDTIGLVSARNRLLEIFFNNQAEIVVNGGGFFIKNLIRKRHALYYSKIGFIRLIEALNPEAFRYTTISVVSLLFILFMSLGLPPSNLGALAALFVAIQPSINNLVASSSKWRYVQSVLNEAEVLCSDG